MVMTADSFLFARTRAYLFARCPQHGDQFASGQKHLCAVDNIRVFELKDNNYYNYSY